jgi:peptidoglycan/LPS O-acetylase OafA/YrhL
MLRMIGIISALGLLAQAFYYVAILHGGSRSYQLPLMRTCGALFFAWIVGAAALERTWKFKAVLLAKPIVYIGRISYGIYLYHLVIPWVLARVFNIHFGRTVGAFLIISALTVLIASLSWLLIETPMNRLKRLAPS